MEIDDKQIIVNNNYPRIRIFFIISIIVFIFSLFLPTFDDYYPLSLYFLIYPSLDGLILLVISTNLLKKLDIDVDLYLGLVGNILIIFNLIINYTSKGMGDIWTELWGFGLQLYLGYLAWFATSFLIFVLLVFYKIEENKATTSSEKGKIVYKIVSMSTNLLGKSKIRFALILGTIGNILIGINLYFIYMKKRDLLIYLSIGYFSTELGIGYYLSLLAWLALCFLTFTLFVSHGLDRYKTIMLSKKGNINNKIVLIMGFVRFVYPLFSFIFLLSLFFPYYYYFSGFFLLINGGWLGTITIVISVVSLCSFRIRASYISGFFGCFFIGFNLLMYLFVNTFDLTSIAFGIGFYMGLISWLVFISINILSYTFKDELTVL